MGSLRTTKLSRASAGVRLAIIFVIVVALAVSLFNLSKSNAKSSTQYETPKQMPREVRS